MRFARRVFSALLGQSSQSLAALLLALVVARAVPPGTRGAFVLLALIPALGGYVATFGLPAAISRAVARQSDGRPELLTTAIVASLGCGLVLTAVTPFAAALADVSVPNMGLVLLGNVSVTWLIFASWFGFGLERFLWAGVIRTLPAVAAVVVVVVIDAAGEASLASIYAAWVVPHAVCALVVAAQLVNGTGWRWPKRSQLAEWSRYGLRYSAFQTTQMMSLRLDQWILGALSSPAAVGVYSIAAPLSESVLVVGRAAGIVVFVDSSSGSTERAFRRQLGILLVLTAAAAALVGALAETLVSLLVSDAYSGASRLIQILLLGTPAVLLLRLLGNRLAGRGKAGMASISSSAALLVSTVLDFILIPSMGATGAAWAAMAGYTFGALVACVLYVGLPSAKAPSLRQSSAPV